MRALTRTGVKMDIGLIALALGLFSATALVGAHTQTSGRNIQYRTFPPDKTGAIVIGIMIVFLTAYLYTKEGGTSDWAVWQSILFIASNAASSASGYIFGYMAMKYMKKDDKRDDSRNLKRRDKRDDKT